MTASPSLVHHPRSAPSETTLPSSLDIRLVVPPEELADGEAAPRPRATGKLLTSMRGVGLALLRLEHLDAVERGDLSLQVDAGEAGSFDVRHWWPDWFPRSGDEDAHGSGE